jgi:hypothetical protein
MAAALGSDWGFWCLLAECRLEATFSLTVAAGLNNQRVGKSYCSKVQDSLPKFREYSEVEGSFGGLFGLKFWLIIFSGLVSPKKGIFRINDLVPIICTIILVISQVVIFSLHATVVGSLSSNFVGFGFKTRGLRDTWHRLLIFQISLKDKQDYRLMGPSAWFSDST